MLARPLSFVSPSRSFRFLLTALASAALLASVATAQQPPGSIESALRLVTKLNLEAGNVKNIDLYAATLHPQAFGVEYSIEEARSLFKQFDIRYRLLSFKLVAVDDDYAYARLEVESRRLAGPPFADNVSESLWVYRLDGAEWKVWSTALLTFEPYVPPRTDPPAPGPQTHLDYRLFGLLMDVLDATPVACESAPQLPEVPTGALRQCVTLPAGALPLPDDPVFKFLVDVAAAELTAWSETELGHHLTATVGAETYVFNYRSDGLVYVDMTR